MQATGPITIASIRVASTANSIHRGWSSMKRASSTHGGRWLARTNYDAFMTHHTTENFRDYGWGISREIALRWMLLDLIDDKSTLVQVMAWCRQATSHYLNQCWPSSVLPYGITRPQWVKVRCLVIWIKKITRQNKQVLQCGLLHFGGLVQDGSNSNLFQHKV